MNNFKYVFFYLALFFMHRSEVLASTPVVVVSNPGGSSNLSELVENVLSWVLSVAGSIALLMLVVGGIMYITSAGDEQKIAVSKKIITWTILGLVIILASYSIIVALDKILT